VLIKHNLKQVTFRGAFGSIEADFTGNSDFGIVSGTHLVWNRHKVPRTDISSRYDN